MGGYGALKWAFRAPGKFAAVGALSAVMDVDEFGKQYKDLIPDFEMIFGRDKVVNPSQNLMFLAKHFPIKQRKKLKVFQAVGQEDFLYQQNQKMRGCLTRIFETNYLYKEETGNHDWDFWDKQIKAFIEWLPCGKKDKSE